MKNEKVEEIESLDVSFEENGISPSNLSEKEIERFGQENIPFVVDTNRSSNSAFYDNSKKVDEYISIGSTPDGALTERLKKKRIVISKKTFLIIVGFIILLIGFGLFYFLRSTKKVALSAVKTRTVEVSIGDELSLDLDVYATFKNIKPTNCILSLTDVDTSKVGKYKYYISCGVNKYDGKIVVKDKTPPVLVTKFVVKTRKDEIKADDFVVSCEDISNCSWSLSNLDDLLLKQKTLGIYKAKIVAVDDEGNSKSVDEDLIISDYEIKSTVICSKKVNSNDFSGSYIITDYIAYDKDNVARYFKEFIEADFDNDEDFKNFSDTIVKNRMNLYNLEGNAVADSISKKIIVSDYKDVDGLFNQSSYDFINNDYIFNGFSCKNNLN